MRRESIQIGLSYEIQSGKKTFVARVRTMDPKTGSFVCVKEDGSETSVKDANRFLRELTPDKADKTPTQAASRKRTAKVEPKGDLADEPQDGAPTRRKSAVDMAHEILTEAGTPMTVPDIVAIGSTREGWNLKGSTPVATLNASIVTEIKKKGDLSRFVRTERGKYASK